MALARLYISAAVLLVAGLFVSFPAKAQEAGWSVCNQTSFVAQVAVGRSEQTSLIVEGWTKIRPGDCEIVLEAPLQPGLHYLHARSSPAHRGGVRKWGGDQSLCVDTAGGFSVESPPDCAAMGLEGRDFRPVLIEKRAAWRTDLEETEPYSLDRARAAGLQRLLTDAAVFSGAIDGYIGRRTRRAIAEFLAENQLDPETSDQALIDVLEQRAIDRGRNLGMTLCNRTDRRVWSAIARRRGDDWESRGWWLLEAGGCSRVIDQELVQTDFFVYGELETGDGPEEVEMLQNGADRFCVGRSKFAVTGRRDCKVAGLRDADFVAAPAPEDGRLVFEFFRRDFAEPSDAS